MFEILNKKELAKNMVMYRVKAPHVAKKVQPGQFVIVRAFPTGERIPLTPANWDPQEGWVDIITFIRGKTTLKMAKELNIGDHILNIAGPLGNPTPMKKFGKILAIGLIAGIIEVYPIAKAWQRAGNEVVSLHVTPNPMIILKDEFEVAVSRHILESFDVQPHWGMDDISKEIVRRATKKVKELLENEHFDLVFVVGPAGGEKAVFNVVKEYGVPMEADLHSIMVDGTGMCGACRVNVGGEVKFACIDGPGFDAYKVDWDELIHRIGFYAPMEKIAMDNYLKALEDRGEQ